MSQMEVFVHVLGLPGNQQMLVNVDLLGQPLEQGQLVDLTVKWTDKPYASLCQTLPPGPLNSQIAGDVGIALGGAVFQHPNAAEAYRITKAAEPPNRCIRVIMHTAEEAHRIPWELLRSASGFCTLQDRVPIVRVAPYNGQRPDGVILDRRLKVMVVLGARDVPCGPEWRALTRALESWQSDVEVQVLTYDPEIKAEIDKAPASQGLMRQIDGRQVTQRITASFIPGSTERLMQIISNEAPQICHLFCHGTSEQFGQLEIAHRGTVAAGDAPLFLERHHLGKLGNSAWLMVLNACETAKPAGNGGAPPAPASRPPSRDGSFATALVAAGIPYVLGMRQRIDSAIVPAFTFAFYEAVFSRLDASLQPGHSCVISLDGALISGQDAICAHFRQNPAEVCMQRPDWSLPVLYRRSKPFCVRAVESAAAGGVDGAGFDSAVHLVAERQTLKEALEEMRRKGVDKPVVTAGITARIQEIDQLLGSA